MRIASDWHLGPRSPPGHGRLALEFLGRASRGGVRVILNGDIFDDLFCGAGRAEAAYPAIAAEMAALASAGRLERTCGNHDPGAGVARVVLDLPGVGRVLVTHGHTLDPINASPIGRLGDAISLRFGRTAVVRGAARLAEVAARAVAERRMIEVFSRRCRAVVEREDFDLGIFGHIHAAHLSPGDRYANSGSLFGEELEYLEVGPEGPRLAALRETDLDRRDRRTTFSR